MFYYLDRERLELQKLYFKPELIYVFGSSFFTVNDFSDLSLLKRFLSIFYTFIKTINKYHKKLIIH